MIIFIISLNLVNGLIKADSNKLLIFYLMNYYNLIKVI